MTWKDYLAKREEEVNDQFGFWTDEDGETHEGERPDGK